MQTSEGDGARNSGLRCSPATVACHPVLLFHAWLLGICSRGLWDLGGGALEYRERAKQTGWLGWLKDESLKTFPDPKDKAWVGWDT